MQNIICEPLTFRSILATLPDDMQAVLHGQAFKTDTVGCSGAHIFLFDHDLVLKVEQKTEVSDTEIEMIRWLNGKLPVPEIKGFHTDGRYNYLLMTRINGRMACDEPYMMDGRIMARRLAQGLKRFWQVPLDGCPRVMDLEHQLSRALWRIEQQKIRIRPETLQANGFASLKAQYDYLYDHRPEETLVLSHGDYCLVNIFLENDEITGFIDFGRCGVAGQWRDITMCMGSLRYNLKLSSREKSFDVLKQLFFDELGFEADEQTMRYYRLLDQLL